MAILAYQSDILTSIVAGVLILGFGILVGNLIAVVSRKALQSFEIDRLLQDIGVRFPFEEFFSSLLRYIVYIAALILGLTFLGLEKIFLYIILFILLGLFIVFILFSLKDFIPNAFAAFIIQFKQKLKKGDIIQIDTIEGKIIHMDMLEIQVRSADNEVVVIPNILVQKSLITKKKK
ncbi:mechanosensitive ion channel [Candidatus Woesearchaeota archaeon]|nr:mechanosensitive ion channel [Candidatus Woesearchaeota archaeon]